MAQPYSTSYEADEGLRRRTAGQGEIDYGTTPVVGRVAGRYEGYDTAPIRRQYDESKSTTSTSAPPAEQYRKNPNTENERLADESARREDDDSKTSNSGSMGVVGMLKNPRNRMYLATLVAATPFMISFTFYVSQFSFFGQFVIGICCGLCLQGVYMLYSLHRKHQRKRKTLQVAQMAILEENQLKILLPTQEAFPRWISFTDFEKVEWLNDTLTKLWPYIDQAASSLIKEKVQPILDQYAMGIIQKLELKQVAFGNKAPQVTGVRLSEGLEDETVLEIKILWETSQEGVVLSVDFPGPNYTVKLKNWFLEGTAKLIFKPLTGTIPGFGAVLVSLTEPPEFDFDLKFLGGDVGMVPGVEKMIDNSIRTALMDSLVWPSRIVVPMIPGGDFSFLELHPVGELEVKLIEAKNIKNTDLIGKADPFVTLFVRQTKDKVKRSTSKSNTLRPVWNEDFKIEVEDPESQALTLRLMDDESVQKSEYIGTVQLAIKEFEPHVKKELWCDVLEDPESHATDQIRGSIHVIVTYIPYTREQVEAKRGFNETEKKIYEEHRLIAEQINRPHKTTGDAPKQQGNITQHPEEQPRQPGPAAEL
ncbi:synaptotagmin-5 isoform X2 [Physcomitrium patens]|uniref:Uncharacterized protein n=2 Tax=Physcomitrium patens TaxID=3218 RepID=A0A2K1IAY7_PHYPA|nr:synaptotagmin-5-like isoform X2 [Physcomitrium patens]XP_024367898.1 synaptotagmin-5-like isoform X2 [Physcomitrium patens]PNR26441.1 hypothetical protein PHYPA_031016 [Physcomitrium patens]|eukprot:XP_024367897.1 synaptotagmin-5-like isoform X2 [Physcomitrella patens]